MTPVNAPLLACQLCGGGSDNNDQLPDLVPVDRLTSYLSHQNVLEGLLPQSPSTAQQLTDQNAPKLYFKLVTSSNPSMENSEHFLLCGNCSSELKVLDNLTNELESIQKRIEGQVLKINEIRQGSSTLTVSPGQVSISGWTSGQDNIWRGWEALGGILEGTLPRLTGSGGGEDGGDTSAEVVSEETGNESEDPEQQELSLFCEVDEDYMPVIKIEDNQSGEILQGQPTTEPNSNQKTCPVCHKILSSSSGLSVHKKIHFMGQSYFCVFCTRYFPRKDKLFLHLLSHIDEKAYVCYLCDKTFIEQRLLNQHSRTHQKILRQFKCTKCWRSYSKKQGLVSHTRRSHGASE